MTIFVTVLHVLVCLILIVVVLLQRGKGAEVGAVFGGGGGTTMFGSRGAGNFLTKLTTGAAVIFMLTSLLLAYFAHEGSRSSIFEGGEPVQEEPSPFGEAGAPVSPEPEQSSPFEEVPAPAPATKPAAPADAPSVPSAATPSEASQAGEPGTEPARVDEAGDRQP